MTNYQLSSHYKHNETYKESFNELAKIVFELDFKEWYENGQTFYRSVRLKIYLVA